MTSFQDLSLRPETRAAIAAMGVETPTPIQSEALPAMLAGRDVIGQARTGSGKTLAFALPIVERIDERRHDVQALVLVPTRELAAQVAGVLRESATGRNLRVLLLIGGVSPGSQKQALLHGVHAVVGTPGRVLDNIRQGTLRLNRLRVLILDEADEMLDRGFAPDVERIIAATDPERQTALFSATVPEWVAGMAAKHLRDPLNVRVDAQSAPVEHVPHAVYDVPAGGKMGALRTLLDARGQGVTLVFGRTKHGVKKLAQQLTILGYPVGALQGNLSQNARDRVMADFRSGEMPILIATNVAARGLDVEHVAQVINYELPETADLLTHRVGRTGRMGRDGEAITLLTPDDEPAWRKLLRDLRRQPVRRPWRGGHDSEALAAETPAGARAVGLPAHAVRPVPLRPVVNQSDVTGETTSQPEARPTRAMPSQPDRFGERERPRDEGSRPAARGGGQTFGPHSGQPRPGGSRPATPRHPDSARQNGGGRRPAALTSERPSSSGDTGYRARPDASGAAGVRAAGANAPAGHAQPRRRSRGPRPTGAPRPR